MLAAALPAQEPPAAPPGTPQQPARPGGPGLLPPAASPVFHAERNTGTALLQQLGVQRLWGCKNLDDLFVIAPFLPAGSLAHVSLWAAHRRGACVGLGRCLKLLGHKSAFLFSLSAPLSNKAGRLLGPSSGRCDVVRTPAVRHDILTSFTATRAGTQACARRRRSGWRTRWRRHTCCAAPPGGARARPAWPRPPRSRTWRRALIFRVFRVFGIRFMGFSGSCHDLAALRARPAWPRPPRSRTWRRAPVKSLRGWRLMA